MITNAYNIIAMTYTNLSFGIKKSRSKKWVPVCQFVTKYFTKYLLISFEFTYTEFGDAVKQHQNMRNTTNTSHTKNAKTNQCNKMERLST